MSLNPQSGEQLIGLSEWNEMVTAHNAVEDAALAATALADAAVAPAELTAAIETERTAERLNQSSTYLSQAPGAGLVEGATKAELDAAVLAGGSNVVNGTVAGQIPVWDTVDERYEPATPTDVTATDVPFTPTGTVAATNVQTAVAEVATDAAAALTAHVDDAVAAHAASAIAVTPSGTLAATTVGAALVELDGEKTASADVDTFVVLTEAAYTALGTKDARTVYLRTP